MPGVSTDRRFMIAYEAAVARRGRCTRPAPVPASRSPSQLRALCLQPGDHLLSETSHLAKELL
ncbi:MAG: hypothetical protein MUO38_03720, partial [Anaerolineales bacterium]|nr:hypothetical protein [Anaerolineales bacterium]